MGEQVAARSKKKITDKSLMNIELDLPVIRVDKEADNGDFRCRCA